MASSAAVRKRMQRQRERNGAIPVRIEVTELVASALEAADFVDMAQLEDKAALSRAIESLLNDWAVRVTL
jgi:hypothetical protein